MDSSTHRLIGIFGKYHQYLTERLYLYTSIITSNLLLKTSKIDFKKVYLRNTKNFTALKILVSTALNINNYCPIWSIEKNNGIKVLYCDRCSHVSFICT